MYETRWSNTAHDRNICTDAALQDGKSAAPTLSWFLHLVFVVEACHLLSFRNFHSRSRAPVVRSVYLNILTVSVEGAWVMPSDSDHTLACFESMHRECRLLVLAAQINQQMVSFVAIDLKIKF